jgi:hypothetical protein
MALNSTEAHIAKAAGYSIVFTGLSWRADIAAKWPRTSRHQPEGGEDIGARSLRGLCDGRFRCAVLATSSRRIFAIPYRIWSLHASPIWRDARGWTIAFSNKIEDMAESVVGHMTFFALAAPNGLPSR